MPASTLQSEPGLTFLGTRGEIDRQSARHRRHSALLMQYGACRIMVDCGHDWIGAVERIAPTAILLTHAHPDHAGGLAAGAPCPVYATAETWTSIGRYPIADRRAIAAGERFHLGAITCMAFPVEHSLRAPAVGFRFTLGAQAWCYLPDVAALGDEHAALAGVRLYIGDGARITRPLIRWRGDSRIGHTSIREQLDWCRQQGVPRAIFTHCGSEIVGADARAVAVRVRQLGRECGVSARVAFDGMRLPLGAALGTA